MITKTQKNNRSPRAKRVGGLNYPAGDFLVRIKNASVARRKEVKVPYSTKTLAIAKTLKRLGFLDEVKKEQNELIVTLSYKKKVPVILDLKLVSTPGLRVYMGLDKIASFRGPYLYLLTTPKGVISSKEAIKEGVGGEVIAKIW